MLNPVYCRRLEDSSGFGVFQRIVLRRKNSSIAVLDEKWETVLGLGETRAEAWKDYRNGKSNPV
jgi:hypothetical protein